MSNKNTVPVTKLEVIKSQIEEIAKKYSIAKSKNDTVTMNKLEEEFSYAKTLLWSNEYHFRYLNSSKIKKMINKAQDSKEKEDLMGALQQKEAYKSKGNRTYLDVVEKSKTIGDYIKNNDSYLSNKKTSKNRKFVKRKLKACVAAISLSAFLVLTGCSNKKDSSVIKNAANAIETTMDNDEVNSNNLNDETVKNNSDNLNAIASIGASTTALENANTNNNQENDKNSVDDLIPSSNKIVVEKPLDPGVSVSTLTVTATTTENITGSSVVEQPAVDYIPLIDYEEEKPSTDGQNEADKKPTIDNNDDEKGQSAAESAGDNIDDDTDYNIPEDDTIDNVDKEENKPSTDGQNEADKESTTDNNDDKKEQSAAEEAGNKIDDDTSYNIPEDDKIDPNCPPAGELPEKEIVHIETKEEIPEIDPATAADNKIDDTKQDELSDDKTNNDDKKEDSEKPTTDSKEDEENKTNDNKDNSSLSAAEAAGDNIDETVYSDSDIKNYEDEFPVLMYENEAVLSIDGEAFTLSLNNRG